MMSANCVFAIVQSFVVTRLCCGLETRGQRGIGFLAFHLLREIERFLAERIFHGPVHGSTDTRASSAAASVCLKEMRRVTDEPIYPFGQSHRRETVLAGTDLLAVKSL